MSIILQTFTNQQNKTVQPEIVAVIRITQ